MLDKAQDLALACEQLSPSRASSVAPGVASLPPIDWREELCREAAKVTAFVTDNKKRETLHALGNFIAKLSIARDTEAIAMPDCEAIRLKAEALMKELEQ